MYLRAGRDSPRFRFQDFASETQAEGPEVAKGLGRREIKSLAEWEWLRRR